MYKSLTLSKLKQLAIFSLYATAAIGLWLIMMYHIFVLAR